MNTYEIRKATEQETSTVIALLKDVAIWLQSNDIDQWGFLLKGGEDEEIRQAIIDNATYVACQNDEILATFTLYSQQSEWDQHIWGQEDISDVLYLHRVAVRPEYMKNGIGKDTLSWIDENVSKTIRLDCVAHNSKLCAYYEKNGFSLIGTTADGHCKFQKIHREGNGN
ncbi:GNAT family N-acetyltransferase [Sporosarcina sp. ACRSL]|uniref:GNAT family N-acetyltransferase n=1 Tax=Sporosarcina sp. ACRSL TaxID=2918215 RepID=UPI001EF693AA|nr:GNAT family N-acetyltransferase [Sporosarcina sp. ACRSL]